MITTTTTTTTTIRKVTRPKNIKDRRYSLVVAATHAVVQPPTMVVERGHALLARGTVLGAFSSATRKKTPSK